MRLLLEDGKEVDTPVVDSRCESTLPRRLRQVLAVSQVLAPGL